MHMLLPMLTHWAMLQGHDPRVLVFERFALDSLINASDAVFERMLPGYASWRQRQA